MQAVGSLWSFGSTHAVLHALEQLGQLGEAGMRPSQAHERVSRILHGPAQMALTKCEEREGEEHEVRRPHRCCRQARSSTVNSRWRQAGLYRARAAPAQARSWSAEWRKERQGLVARPAARTERARREATVQVQGLTVSAGTNAG